MEGLYIVLAMVIVIQVFQLLRGSLDYWAMKSHFETVKKRLQQLHDSSEVAEEYRKQRDDFARQVQELAERLVETGPSVIEEIPAPVIKKPLPATPGAYMFKANCESEYVPLRVKLCVSNGKEWIPVSSYQQGVWAGPVQPPVKS